MKALCIFISLCLIISSAYARFGWHHDIKNIIDSNLSEKNVAVTQTITGDAVTIASCIIFSMRSIKGAILGSDQYAFMYYPEKKMVILYYLSPPNPTCKFDVLLTLTQGDDNSIIAKKYQSCVDEYAQLIWLSLLACDKSDFTGIKWY